MQEPNENKNTSLDLTGVGDIAEAGVEIAAEGVFETVGGFLGDAVGGVLEVISIDI